MKKYYIFTLGCQMNVSDSQRIVSLLSSLGLRPTSEKEADLIIVNACSVRQTAVDRIYGKIKLWRSLKPQKTIFITGCILPSDNKKLKEKVDLIFNIKDLPKLPQMLSNIKKNKFEKNIRCNEDYFKISNNQLPATNNHYFIYIPIMTGCDNFCTYCAVPYTRGREKSRSEKDIIRDVKEALKKGFKEIILLGQNVNRYNKKSARQRRIRLGRKIRNPKSEMKPFAKLLDKIVKIPGNFKIKFMSPNPWDLPDSLIELIAKEDKISKEIHLPLQSGDDQILKKMNRPYTTKQYLSLIHKLKVQIPNINISTDIIVGFPGETKKAFQNTYHLCKKAQFEKAYIAMYSPRPGTAATKLKDNVTRQEKKKRWQKLNELINSKS